MIYPLTVAAKSNKPSRNQAANKVIKNMRDHSNTLVQHAMLVSEELIRVAILWHELWHEGLEEASRLYFGERNVKGMFAALEPLHQMIERGPQTLKETSFNQVTCMKLLLLDGIPVFNRLNSYPSNTEDVPVRAKYLGVTSCLFTAQAYGRDLMEAQEWCRKYQRSGNVKDLTQAWDLYYHVFRRISKQLPQASSCSRPCACTNRCTP